MHKIAQISYILPGENDYSVLSGSKDNMPVMRAGISYFWESLGNVLVKLGHYERGDLALKDCACFKGKERMTLRTYGLMCVYALGCQLSSFIYIFPGLCVTLN